MPCQHLQSSIQSLMSSSTVGQPTYLRGSVCPAEVSILQESTLNGGGGHKQISLVIGKCQSKRRERGDAPPPASPPPRLNLLFTIHTTLSLWKLASMDASFVWGEELVVLACLGIRYYQDMVSHHWI